MTMHNPPHPGEFIRSVYLDPFGISSRSMADYLHEPWTYADRTCFLTMINLISGHLLRSIL